MKPAHIILLIFIITAIGVVISLFVNANPYSDFTTAAHQPGKEFQIIGKLLKEKPIQYESEKDANSFTFFMADEKGTESKVVFKGAKPQDFEKSEQVVVIGKMQDSLFIGSKLLLKCPSKYNDESKPEAFDTKSF